MVHRNNVDLDDTYRAKSALNRLGYYTPTKIGITKYPDERLFEGLKSFQADQGLQRDGVMKPHGPTATRLGAVINQKGGKSDEKPDKETEKKPEKKLGDKANCEILRKELRNATIDMEAAKDLRDKVQEKYNQKSEEVSRKWDIYLKSLKAFSVENAVNLLDIKKGRLPRNITWPSEVLEARKVYEIARRELENLGTEQKWTRDNAEKMERRVKNIRRKIRAAGC